MIEITKTDVVGWEHAIRGMRNPLNSWDKSDTKNCYDIVGNEFDDTVEIMQLDIGEKDLALMKKLANAGTDHGKYLRFIQVYCDINAPLYWWKEYDTYKVGTVANSCSTMHKIHTKYFTLSDFSIERISKTDLHWFETNILGQLNYYRDEFINYDEEQHDEETPSKKDYWYSMIQLLPSSYNQKRTCELNYQVLKNMYHSRKNHKLDEWHTFCEWIESLPYSELITGDKS